MNHYRRPTDSSDSSDFLSSSSSSVSSSRSSSRRSSRSSRSSRDSSSGGRSSWFSASSTGTVTRYVNRDSSLSIRLAEHFLRGPFAGKHSHHHKYSGSKKHLQHHSHNQQDGRQQHMARDFPPPPVRQYPGYSNPPPPPLGVGGQGFVQLNRPGPGRPPQPMMVPGRGPVDPIWGRQQAQWRPRPPPPSAELVDE